MTELPRPMSLSNLVLPDPPDTDFPSSTSSSSTMVAYLSQTPPASAPTAAAPTSENRTTAAAEPEKPIPPFLKKVLEMLADPESNGLIGWSEEHRGAAFVVWNPAELAVKVLPKYFKHGQFPSFVRQLNNYGFHKIDSKKGFAFSNRNFRKGRPDLLKCIKRRRQLRIGDIDSDDESQVVEVSPPRSHSHHSPPAEVPHTAPAEPPSELETLQREISRLQSTNEEMQQMMLAFRDEVLATKRRETEIISVTQRVLEEVRYVITSNPGNVGVKAAAPLFDAFGATATAFSFPFAPSPPFTCTHSSAFSSLPASSSS